MSSMFFGHYLLERGAIGREALLDAIKRQREVNLSLADLAAEQGLISASTADQIRTLYRISERTMEDLCRAEGGLAGSDIDHLKKIQADRWLRIGQALVAGGHLSEEAVEAHFAGYREREMAEQKTLDEDFDHLPEPRIVRACTELALRHVARITGLPVKLQKISTSDGILDDGWYRFSQNIVGDRWFRISVDFPEPVFAIAANGMLGVAVDPASEAAIDAGCELVNLIGGNACTRLEPDGLRLRPEPPYATTRSLPGAEDTSTTRAIAMAGEETFGVTVIVAPP